MKWIWINKSFLLKTSWQYAGTVYAIIGLAGMLANLDEVIAPEYKPLIRVCIGVGILFAIWIVIFGVCCIYYNKKKKISVLKILNNHNVFLQYGNLFAEALIAKDDIIQHEKRNLIIPVNCCFDTIVDDDLISSKKIHGIALKRLYDSGRYSQESLNSEIQKSLELQGIGFINLNKQTKRKGNLKRFPFGTVVEIAADEYTKYFLLALTEFNSTLHAEIHNRENYILALQRLIEYISSRSQGFPTIMPIIGGGLPELSDSEQAILELILKLVKLNKDKINCDLHIVIRESAKDEISIFSLKN